jgi:hypothetical protein
MQKKQSRWILAGFILLSSVRFVYVLGDLWLDEIWSLFAAHGVGDFPLFDGHLSLYTKFLKIFLLQTNPYLLRFPSTICALTGTFIFIYLTPFITTPVRLIWGVLVLPSFFLALYGSEARPYGGMILFGALSIISFLKIIKGYLYPYLFIFWFTTILTLSIHLSFIFTYTGLLIYSLIKILSNFKSINIHAYIHSLPTIGLAIFWYVNLNNLPTSTGSRLSYLSSLVNLVSATFGGPLITACSETFTIIALILFLCLLAISLVVLTKLPKEHAQLLCSILILGPVLVMLFLRPTLIYPRYFLMQSYVLTLLVAIALSSGLVYGRFLRYLSLIILTGIFIGNIAQAIFFAKVKRGEPSKIISLLYKEQPTSLGVDHDFRIPLVFNYLQQYYPEYNGAQWTTLSYKDSSTTTNTSLFSHLVTHTFDPYCSSTQKFPKCTKLISTSYNGLAGWGWTVFRCNKQD